MMWLELPSERGIRKATRPALCTLQPADHSPLPPVLAARVYVQEALPAHVLTQRRRSGH